MQLRLGQRKWCPLLTRWPRIHDVIERVHMDENDLTFYKRVTVYIVGK